MTQLFVLRCQPLFLKEVLKGKYKWERVWVNLAVLPTANELNSSERVIDYNPNEQLVTFCCVSAHMLQILLNPCKT